MSEPLDIEAIRKRTDTFEMLVREAQWCQSETISAIPAVGQQVVDDIDALLDEVERLRPYATPCPHGYYGPGQVCWICR